MKQAVNPVVAGIVIVIAAVGLILWLVKGTGGIGGSGIAPGAKGNPSPFGPGGAAVTGGGANPEVQKGGRANTGGGPPVGR